MAESLVNLDLDGRDPFRAGAVLSCLVMGLSYLLPWATVDGTGQPIEDTSRTIKVTETVQGSVSPREIALFPEVIVAVAAGVVLITALRWTVFWQFFVGVLGLGAGFASLYIWAFVDADGQGSFVDFGSYTAFPAAFDPATGLWLAIFGSLGLIVCGFAAATRRYVRIKQHSD
jgi:hypothetical protein